jgi:poly(A) polymerase
VEASGRIDPPAWTAAPDTRIVMEALAADGATARFVGGCVRDAILGWPVTDIDIATSETPEAATALLQKAGIRVVPTGIAHGTVTAVVGSAHFEITTLRRDVETFGRHARVAFTDDWVADAERRDFTINAMFCDADGTLYDPTGGFDDLHAGRVRFVGDPERRIGEDVLRLLRFFRFYAHYGRSPPDAAALAACRAMAGELGTLSAERVWSELGRLLLAPAPAAVFELMDATAILAELLPEADDRPRLEALSGIEAAQGIAADSIRRFAAVVTTDRAGAEAIAGRLRMSNAERDHLVLLAAPAAVPVPGIDAPARRALLYRLGATAMTDLALLGWAGEAAAGGTADVAGWTALLDAAEGWTAINFPLAGKDVLALGVARGPAIGRLMSTVEEWWIAGDFRAGREACLRKLKDAVANL